MRWLILGVVSTFAVSGAWAGELLNGGDLSHESVGAAGDQAVSSQRWKLFSSASPIQLRLEEDPLHAPKHALWIGSHAQAGSYEGLFQEVPVTGGKTYTLSVQVLNDKAGPLKPGSTGMLSVEWLDAQGKEISREEGTAWDSSISGSEWKTQKMTSSSPANAVKAHFVVEEKDLATDTPGGAFYISNFSVQDQ